MFVFIFIHVCLFFSKIAVQTVASGTSDIDMTPISIGKKKIIMKYGEKII